LQKEDRKLCLATEETEFFGREKHNGKEEKSGQKESSKEKENQGEGHSQKEKKPKKTKLCEEKDNQIWWKDCFAWINWFTWKWLHVHSKGHQGNTEKELSSFSTFRYIAQKFEKHRRAKTND
jgi:hypothetical protein